jgi:hypothetical protein
LSCTDPNVSRYNPKHQKSTKIICFIAQTGVVTTDNDLDNSKADSEAIILRFTLNMYCTPSYFLVFGLSLTISLSLLELSLYSAMRTLSCSIFFFALSFPFLWLWVAASPSFQAMNREGGCLFILLLSDGGGHSLPAAGTGLHPAGRLQPGGLAPRRGGRAGEGGNAALLANRIPDHANPLTTGVERFVMYRAPYFCPKMHTQKFLEIGQ